ncbi:myb/SANT-like DNA-binding domain-containing protein 3 [Ornithodoros turicata]|uniref:myb/SANT-like DNA-binding domain-containing protein 3 n=1 Tax=Ornithodoros turicata TaxID=34597 RepID=UPI0031396146
MEASHSSQRTPYTVEEKELLLELVSKYKTIIENKQSDNAMLRAKARTWEKLAQEFNAQTNVTKRDVKQLKKCLENIKSKAKKENARQRQHIYATGGGPPLTRDDSDSVSQRINDVLPHISYRIPNSWDSDALDGAGSSMRAPHVAQSEGGDRESAGELLQNTDAEDDNEDSHAAGRSHVQATESQLTTRKRPHTIAEQVREEVTARVEKVEAEKVAALELYELKKKFAQQQNDAKLAIYRKKLRIAELKEQLLLKQLQGQSIGSPMHETFL